VERFFVERLAGDFFAPADFARFLGDFLADFFLADFFLGDFLAVFFATFLFFAISLAPSVVAPRITWLVCPLEAPTVGERHSGERKINERPPDECLVWGRLFAKSNRASGFVW